jgi:hypothetical protein
MPRPLILLLVYALISTTLGLSIHPGFFMMFILPVVLTVIDMIASDFNTSSIMLGIFKLGKMKRVHTQYGRFYIVPRIYGSQMIYLYQDRLFYLKYIDHTHYNGVESSKNWIKAQYDVIYYRKKAKNDVLNEIKNWNGYIDIQTERDKKLEKIL